MTKLIKTVFAAALLIVPGTSALALADGPEGQVFEATGVASWGEWQRFEGETATISFDGGGTVTVSGVTDAMGSDPFTGAWVAFSNGRIRVDLDLFWVDPEAAGEDAPECYSWPDYPIGTPIEDVSGDWGSEGTCWTGGDVSDRWRIVRVE